MKCVRACACECACVRVYVACALVRVPERPQRSDIIGIRMVRVCVGACMCASACACARACARVRVRVRVRVHVGTAARRRRRTARCNWDPDNSSDACSSSCRLFKQRGNK